MNEYIRAQIGHMTALVKTFEQSCAMAAQKDDGKIDKEEARQLKKIHQASEKFIQQLTKIDHEGEG